MMIQLFAIVLSLNSNVALASQEEPTIQQELVAIDGALQGTRDFIHSARGRDFRQIAEQQLDRIIKEIVQELRGRNDQVLADELVGRWTESKSLMFVNMKDLGDHSPLLPWLEAFFQKVSDKYGTIILSLPMISDVRTLNFSIPVVFSPRGSWQMVGVDSRIEFRKHFIPFANIITYYASNYGCLYILQQNGLSKFKKLCGKAADKLKFVMGRYLAPVISDFVFKATNNNTNNSETLEFTEKELVYTTAEQLLDAVKSEE